MKARLIISPAIILLLALSALIIGGAPASADTEKAKELFNQAIEAMKKNDTAGAITYYTAAIGQDGDFADAYLNLGSIMYAKGQYQDAAKNFKKLTELTPTNAQGFLNYGQTLLKLDKYDDAMLAFQGALKADPNFSEADKELAKLYLKKENYDDCIKSMEKYVKTNTKDSYAFYVLGMAYKRKKDNANAISNFKSAVALDPKDTEALFNLGNIYLDQKSYSDAAKYFEQTVQANPKHFRAAYNLAIAVETSDPENHPAAVTAWENFLKIARKSPQARNLIDGAEKHVGDLKAAMKK